MARPAHTFARARAGDARSRSWNSFAGLCVAGRAGGKIVADGSQAALVVGDGCEPITADSDVTHWREWDGVTRLR